MLRRCVLYSDPMGRRRLLLLCALIFIALTFFKCIIHFHINVADEEFTNIDLCPACYGKSLCPHFYHGQIVLIGGSKLKYFQFLNSKNVYYGKLNGERIVLKKLAHDWEFKESDRSLCKLANMSYYCNISTAVRKLVSGVSYSNTEYFTTVLRRFNASTDLAMCPSERLLSYIYAKISMEDAASENGVQTKDIVEEMMYGMLVNPESVILQAFTRNEGWPFPQYRGSCGRLIVEEYVGRSLDNYEWSSWLQRLDLSYQLLQIAQQLTENSLDFAFYLTDVSMYNFAVKPDGTLLLVDVENIVIVDRKNIRRDENRKSRYHTSRGEHCRDCLSFSDEDLCSHDLSDHNYYAICRGLLVPGAYYSTIGLLHDIPPNVEGMTNMSALLSECAEPTHDLGRFVVVPKLLQVMKSLL